MEDLKKLKVKNWKETAKKRRTWRDLAEMAKTPQRVVVPDDDVCHGNVKTFCVRQNVAPQ